MKDNIFDKLSNKIEVLNNVPDDFYEKVSVYLVLNMYTKLCRRIKIDMLEMKEVISRIYEES